MLVKEQWEAGDDGHRFHVAASQFHIALAKASRNQALFVAARALRLNHDRLLEPVVWRPVRSYSAGLPRCRLLAARHRLA